MSHTLTDSAEFMHQRATSISNCSSQANPAPTTSENHSRMCLQSEMKRQQAEWCYCAKNCATNCGKNCGKNLLATGIFTCRFWHLFVSEVMQLQWLKHRMSGHHSKKELILKPVALLGKELDNMKRRTLVTIMRNKPVRDKLCLACSSTLSLRDKPIFLWSSSETYIETTIVAAFYRVHMYCKVEWKEAVQCSRFAPG